MTRPNPYPDPIQSPFRPKTKVLRLPAAGPEPANTLVHLHCLIAGVEEYSFYGFDSRYKVQFETEFAIAGYDQRFYEWYLDTTEVSATAMLRHMSATTDFIFTIVVEEIEWFIDFATGALGFIVTIRSVIDDEAWFPESSNTFITETSVSAWVLCWEPAAERPRAAGPRRTTWAKIAEPSIWPKPRRMTETEARRSPAGFRRDREERDCAD